MLTISEDRLIEAFRIRPNLWQRTHKLYYKYDQRKISLREVALEIGLDRK